MTYSIKIKASAAKTLSKLPEKTQRRLAAAIDDLAHEPTKGRRLKGGLQGLWRIRVGEYRVVYDVQQGELVVLVVRVAHRREVYR